MKRIWKIMLYILILVFTIGCCLCFTPNIHTFLASLATSLIIFSIILSNDDDFKTLLGDYSSTFFYLKFAFIITLEVILAIYYYYHKPNYQIYQEWVFVVINVFSLFTYIGGIILVLILRGYEDSWLNGEIDE